MEEVQAELNKVRKFALKFPGIGNLSRLPSGTTQLQQMKRPLIINFLEGEISCGKWC